MLAQQCIADPGTEPAERRRQAGQPADDTAHHRW
jgi:hypothetical protein